MKTIFLVGVTLCIASVSAASEPLGFKEAKLGMPLTEFFDRFDRELPKAAGQGNLTAGHTVQMESLSTGWAIMAQKRDVGPTGRFGADTIAGKPCNVTYLFFAASEEQLNLAAGPISAWAWRTWTPEEKSAAAAMLLGTIRLRLAQGDFAAVVEAMAARFGSPTSSETKRLTNAMGASFSSLNLTWLRGDDVIQAEERSGKIDQSEIRIGRLSLAQNLVKANEANVEEAKKDM